MQNLSDFLKENSNVEIIDGSDMDLLLSTRTLETSKIDNGNLNRSFQNKEFTLESFGPFINEKNEKVILKGLVLNSIEQLFGIIQPIKRLIKAKIINYGE